MSYIVLIMITNHKVFPSIIMMMMTMMIKLMKNDLNLTFKLTVHCSRGFSKLLVQTLSAALVSRDCPIPEWQIQKSNDDDNCSDFDTDKMLLMILGWRWPMCVYPMHCVYKDDYLMYVSLLLGPPPGLGVVRGIEEDAANGSKVIIGIFISIL